MSFRLALEGWPPDGATGHITIPNDESAVQAQARAPPYGHWRNQLDACQEEIGGEGRRRSGSDNDDLGGELEGARHSECEAGSLKSKEKVISSSVVLPEAEESAPVLRSSLFSQARPEVSCNQQKQLKDSRKEAREEGAEFVSGSNRREENKKRFLWEEREKEREREFQLRRARKSDRRRERERSSSITSDYFSSTQNSPVVVTKSKSNLPKQLSLRQKEKQEKCKQFEETKSGATIYENPLFASNEPKSEEHQKVRSMKTQRREIERQWTQTQTQTKAEAQSRQETDADSLSSETKSGPKFGSNSGKSGRRNTNFTCEPLLDQEEEESVGQRREEQFERNSSRNRRMRQQQNSSNYYYSTPQASNAIQLNSLASSQLTNETCDESPGSNTDESTRHQLNLYAQPEESHFYQQPASPCRSIQRIVSSLFAQQQLQQLETQMEAEVGARGSLVPDEPLIRSSSWQNKTLIDLRQHQTKTQTKQHQANSGLHYLESSLVQKTLPQSSAVRYSQFPNSHPIIEPQQPNSLEHLYCGLTTLRNSANARPEVTPSDLLTSRHSPYPSEQPMKHYKSETMDQSFHTLVDKMNERNFYRLPNCPPPLPPTATIGLPYYSNTSPSSNSTLDRKSFVHNLCARTMRANKCCYLLLLLLAVVVCSAIIALIITHESAAAGAGGGGLVVQDSFATRAPPFVRLPAPQPKHTIPLRPAPTPPSTPMTTTTPTQPPSTQSYWQVNWEKLPERRTMNCSALNKGNECSGRGECNQDTCFCFASFSGPNCAQANCPNECSQRGQCKLKPDSTINNLGAALQVSSGRVGAQLESVSFASLSGSRWRNSICPGKLESEFNQSWAVRLSERTRSSLMEKEPVYTYDNRLEWRCQCEPGFAGADCSRRQELECEDEKDDDLDGLVDCEDDDCCSQSVCRENLMCLAAPEPKRVLERIELQAPTRSEPHQHHHFFFSQVRFLIANESLQSYANESAFDPTRTSVVRGRVVNSGRAIGGVRVGVLGSAQFGFTLTRADGYFDMLVNGDEWHTLQFHRNAFVPIKRKLFLRPNTINTLEEEVEMWLAAATKEEKSLRETNELAVSSSGDFGVRFAGELYKLSSVGKRDDERARAQLFQCLVLGSQQTRARLDSRIEPKLILDQQQEHLHTFALVSSEAQKVSLEAGKRLSLNYNSAFFGPSSSVSKPVVSVQLLPADFTPPTSLLAIQIRLDIEGQTRRERLEPLAGLSYQFAWNRRNVYGQKVYGFGGLRLQIGYELDYSTNQSGIVQVFTACDRANERDQTSPELVAQLERLKLSSESEPHTIWFERKVYMEAEQLNQLTDAGKWSLSSVNRLDLDRELVYFQAGWTLPFKLIYPPLVLEPKKLSPELNPPPEQHSDSSRPSSRSLARGPNSSLFVLVRAHSQNKRARLIQLDSTGKRRLLDLPLAALTSKLDFAPQEVGSNSEQLGDDIQILYNNYLSTLYLSSKLAAKIVQVSYSSLLVLNKTLSLSSSTAAAEDEIEIEPLCGFGRQLLASGSPAEAVRPARLTRLLGPHSMALDERRQLLYFVDGHANLLALDLNSQLLFLLQALGPNQRTPTRKPEGEKPTCWPKTSSLRDYKAHKIHSLVWSSIESSLYFVDQNYVFALRQDFTLETLAWGANRTPSLQAQLANCQLERQWLGAVKSLAVDDSNEHLLILHQWNQQQQQQTNKSNGLFYLAKLKLGFKSQLEQRRPVIDLHSAGSAWDPQIANLANAATNPINWLELANVAAKGAVSQQRKKTPFIHLSAGFKRVDSIEISSSHGSIFVLDSGSITMIEPYSSKLLSDFNQLERHDVNINRLLLPPPPPSTEGQSESSQQNDHQQSDESRSLNVLFFQNPISAELMEFHSSSGLQLSLTSSNGNQATEFYYKVLTSDSGNKALELDEDDKYDFQAQRLILGQMNSQNFSLTTANSYIRLEKILDLNTRSQFELVRAFTGSKFVLQSILENRLPICELATDYSGLLTAYQQPDKDYWIELIYDSSTYLLRDMLTKVRPTVSQINGNKDWRQLKRTAHDRIFYHYCDLFIVNA